MTMTIMRGLPKVETIGVYELSITKDVVQESSTGTKKGTYIHIVNKNNGREGEVWETAADLLLETAILMGTQIAHEMETGVIK